MRIGIITILKVNNYGAELQAYATQAVLHRLGHDAEIIDYLFYKNPEHEATELSKPVFKFGWKKRIAEWLYPKLEKLKTGKNSEYQRRRTERFEQFHRTNTRMSRTYKTVDDLYMNASDYDIYMTGSDQVWNPGIYSSLEPYLLTFAPKGKKRITYASSFGVSKLPEKCVPFYAERLKCMDAIGVREEQAVQLVKEVSGKKAEWVLDPTLLLNAADWRRIAEKTDVPEGGYILLYELTPCPYIKKLALYLSGLLKGKTIVRICKQAVREDEEADIINITDAGPAEFLYLFSKASMVITNSFHGTAFSINFQRPFYTVLPLRKQNNSRQRSLLKLFGLADRLLVEGDSFPEATELMIDYTSVDNILVRERAKSIHFLEESVNGK